MVGWLGIAPQSANALGQMQTVNEPFLWGPGGARMTPEDIAFQRRLAASQQQVDYSPVGHWTQGLARLTDNIGGALRERRADRAAQENAAEADAVMRALMANGGAGASNGSVVAALLNPNLPAHVRDFAEMRYEQMNPKARTPTEFERELVAAGIMPGTPEYVEAMQKRVGMKTDPEVIVPLPGGLGTYVGPRSGLSDLLKGGGPLISPSPGAAPPPSTLPPDFDFNEGGPASKAPASFP